MRRRSAQLARLWEHHSWTPRRSWRTCPLVKQGGWLFEGLSSCSAEFVESFGQSIDSWPVRGSRWQGKESAVHFLKAVPEHRPIDFFHEGTVDVDDVIR